MKSQSMTRNIKTWLVQCLAQLVLIATAEAQEGSSIFVPEEIGELRESIQKSGDLSGAKVQHWYQFTTRGAVKRIDFGGRSLSGRRLTVSLLADADNNGLPETLASDLVGAGGIAFTVLLDPGTYYVRADEYDGDTAFEFTLAAQDTESPGTADNSMVDAVPLGTIVRLVTRTDFLGAPDGVDWYRFQIQGGVHKVSVSALSVSGPRVNYTVLSDLNNDGIGEAIDGRLVGPSGGGVSVWLDPGVYYVRVDNYDGNTMYTVAVNATPMVSTGSNDNAPSGAFDLGPLSSLKRVQEFVGTPDKVDWYRFQIDAEVKRVSVSVASLQGPRVHYSVLRDSNNDGVPEALDSTLAPAAGASLSIWLDPGIYFVRVDNYDGNTEYQLGMSAEPRDSYGLHDNDMRSAFPLGGLSALGTRIDYIGLSDGIDVYSFDIVGASRSAVISVVSLWGPRVLFHLARDGNNDNVAEVIGQDLAGSGGATISSLLEPGRYYVAVWTYDGNTEYRLGYSASLPAGTPPFVTRQPEDVVVFAGQSASFGVVAEGSGKLEYQWYHGSNTISGATNALYRIETTRESDAGEYSVLVDSEFGEPVRSRVAVLTVNDAGTRILIERAVYLSWDEKYRTWVLQTSESPTGPWIDIEPPLRSVVQDQFVAAVRSAPTQQYFRLRQP